MMKRFAFSSWLAAVTVIFLPVTVQAVTAITDTTLIQLTGQTADQAGRSVATGDLNGDGFDDLIIGAIDATNPGSVYIIYGSTAVLTTQTLSATAPVVELTGASATDELGISLATGDINGDGYDDVLVGADLDDGAAINAGTFYLIYGSTTQLTSGTIAAVSAKFTGETTVSGNVGISVAAGDVNNDGYDDMVIGANKNNDTGAIAGAVLLIYGQSTQFTSATLTAATVVQFSGKASSDLTGTIVRTGDVNNDDFADILISAPQNVDCAVGGSSKCGTVFLMYGQSAALTSTTISSSTIAFRGEAANDTFGSIATGDINGDGYDDVMMGASANDDGGSDAGAAYITYGQSATLATTSASTLTESTGIAAGDNAGGPGLMMADLSNDGYADLLVGAHKSDDGSTDGGALFVTYGSASTFTGTASLGVASAFEITGTSASENLGRAATTGDLNGDGLLELIIGAPAYSSGVGAVYVGYVSMDADNDGELASTGLVFTGTDCNDADATVTANQTYYADSDADTLGDPVVTTMVCSSTAPAGYVANATDTNDTIPNNGVEIGNDSIDNDGDGSIDEANTTTENGAHPYYSTLDSTDTAVVATAITAITATTDGLVQVTYADNSVYTFSAFTGGDDALAVAQYQDTGYVLALQSTGKNLALLNVLTGVVDTTVTLSKTKRYSVNSLKLLDVRNDGAVEAVITSRSKAKVLLSIVKVNLAGTTLKKYDSVTATNKSVTPSKTTVKKKTLLLKSKKGKALLTYNVTKQYALKLVSK
ncbi:MAG: FG-GAP repeat protein [Candidatus Kerfeldbacteria bacterium]|nr:FG-GAP repeat protein [Candidatus Kerfeldbacteria bacterium]